MKRIVSQEDLDLNPELAEEGVKVGDEIEFPDPAEPTSEGEEDTKEDGPGNDQPPGSQPDKP